MPHTSPKSVWLPLVGLTMASVSPSAPTTGAQPVRPAGETSIMSAYELDTCAVALADALRVSKSLTGHGGGPVRLLAPQWRNHSDRSIPDPDRFVSLLCERFNEWSGAAVAFEVGSESGSMLWEGSGLRRLPTRLTLAKQRKRGRYELVLEVFDRDRSTRLVEVRHRIRLARGVPSGQASSNPPRPAEEFVTESVPQESDEPARRADLGPAPRERGRDRAASERDSGKRRIKTRRCRLPHFWAVPEDEDVELELELERGRLLFLDRKSADRLVHISERYHRSGDAITAVEVELACRKKKLEVEVWAEFFDGEGRGLHRTRKQELRFREGRIRTALLESVVPADKVVVFVEKD